MFKLSICMIVKDEEKNLGNCLESLKGVREEVISELIIVDTGSVDNTVSIAKKYTDKVYFHKWNDDFSESRNISISYAKGEWILIIDADEELKEYDGLSGFLKNEKQSVNVGLIKSRDITSLSNEKSYFEYLSPRLFRNNGEFKYEGKVHNQPIYDEPSLLIRDTLLLHYGYNGDDKSLIERKTKRTENLLKKELEKNPDDIYYLYQLSATYRMRQDYYSSYKVILKAFNLIKAKERSESTEYIYILKQYVLTLKDLGKDQELLSELEKLEKIILKDMDICFYYADSLENLNELKKSEFFFKQYLLLREEYLNNEENLNLSNEIQTLELKEKAYLEISKISFKLSEFDESIEHLKCINVDSKYFIEAIPIMISICFDNRSAKELEEFVLKVKETRSEEISRKFLSHIENELLKKSEDFRKKMEKKVQSINIRYRNLIKLRNDFREDQEIDLGKLERLLVPKFDLDEIYYSDLLYYKLKLGYDIIDYLSCYNKFEVEKILDYLNKKYRDFGDEIQSVLKSQNEDLRKVRVYNSIRKLIIEESLKLDNRYIIYKDYILDGLLYIYKLYNNRFIEKNYNLIEDSEYRFFCSISKLIQEKDQSFFNKEYIAKLYKEYPSFKKVIDYLDGNRLKVKKSLDKRTQ